VRHEVRVDGDANIVFVTLTDPNVERTFALDATESQVEPAEFLLSIAIAIETIASVRGQSEEPNR
jgi:hypothetical protein